MGVQTPCSRTPAARARSSASAGAILQPDDVAQTVVEALAEERFLVLPHPEVLDYFRFKGSDYDRWLGGMRRLQTQILPTPPRPGLGAILSEAPKP